MRHQCIILYAFEKLVVITVKSRTMITYMYHHIGAFQRTYNLKRHDNYVCKVIVYSILCLSVLCMTIVCAMFVLFFCFAIECKTLTCFDVMIEGKNNGFCYQNACKCVHVHANAKIPIYSKYKVA